MEEIIKYNNDFNNYILVKIIMAGTISLGKSFLLKRINKESEKNEFKIIDKNYEPTIGRDFTLFFFQSRNKLFKIQIWDVSGQERWKDTIFYLARGAGSILIFYDSFDRNSFTKAVELYNDLYKLYPNSIYVLIRSKYDLFFKEEKEYKDYVSDEEALEFADKNNILFSHLSCYEKYETGINDLFASIFLKYINQNNI